MSASGSNFVIDFSGIDDIDAQALSEVLTPRHGDGASNAGVQSAGAGLSAQPAGAGSSAQPAGAGLSALTDQSLLHSPGVSMTSSSGSDDEKSMSCGSESLKRVEQTVDIEMGVMSDDSCGLEVEGSDGVEADDGSSSCGLEVEGFDDHSQSPMVAEGDWLPGENCGRWVAQDSPLNEQACVFITNACMVASRLPKRILRAAVGHLHPGTARFQKSYAWHLVSSLLCISVRSVQRVLKRVKKKPYNMESLYTSFCQSWLVRSRAGLSALRFGFWTRVICVCSHGSVSGR